MFYKQQSFFKKLVVIVLPIIIQNLLSSTLNFIDVFMIGQLGEDSIAAVGSSNQFYFIVLMLVFGISSGSAIFSSQYWGKKDIVNIKRMLSIGLSISLLVTLLIAVFCITSPDTILKLFSSDTNVINLGSDYLKIVAISFVMMSITINVGVTLRSTENVIYPMIASLIGILTNTILNYILIFGKFGFQEYGVIGAAYATIISRSLELVILICISYFKKLPSAMKIQQFFDLKFIHFKIYFSKALPVIISNFGWATGYSVYSMIYGHINTESLVAFNISGSIERICMIFFTGFGMACSIMVGNKLGTNNIDDAKGYANNFILLGLIFSLIISINLFFLKSSLANIFNLNNNSELYLKGILIVMSFGIFFKATNIIFNMGIFKAGGDTLFSMIIDVGGVWLIGLPIAFIFSFFFKFSIQIVVGLVLIEEVIKVILGYMRFKSEKWLNNIIDETTKEKLA